MADRGRCLVCCSMYRVRRDGSVGLHLPGKRIGSVPGHTPGAAWCEGSLLPCQERVNRSGPGYVLTFIIVYGQPWLSDGRLRRRVRGVRTYVESGHRGLHGDTDVAYETPSQQIAHADVDDWLYWAGKASPMRGGP